VDLTVSFASPPTAIGSNELTDFFISCRFFSTRNVLHLFDLSTLRSPKPIPYLFLFDLSPFPIPPIEGICCLAASGPFPFLTIFAGLIG